MWKNYFSVTSVEDALELLAKYRERARIVAGGTDILIELERGQRAGVDTLIDVSRVPELDCIRQEGQTLVLGPTVNHNQAVANPLIRAWAFPLAAACWKVGAPQIRNRGTIAGNLITASPANDTIVPLMALGASVTLRSVKGDRTIPLVEFYTGVRKTVMQPDELLTAIHIPIMQPNQVGTFLRLELRQAQAISVVSVTAILAFEADRIQSAKITLGAVAPTIIRVPLAEEYLAGKTLTDAVIAETARLTASVPRPIDDVRASASYRTEMVKVLIARVLRSIRDGSYKTHVPTDPAMLWGGGEPPAIAPLPVTLRHERDAAETITTTVNGRTVTVTGGVQLNLLDFLRDYVGLTGTKEGCAEGECGACTVFLDGVAVMACMVPAPRAHGAEIITIEGLASDGNLHPLQQAFLDTGAVQCGYCIPGFLMSGAKLLEEYPHPTDEQVAQSISGNLCRCTGYYKIIEAFHKAVKGS
ncbi:MAG: FAD binding domain-containing protein [Anaerolineales bacterium]|nr:FAD binding domain-containing protein [Anaerolineales bacterium]